MSKGSILGSLFVTLYSSQLTNNLRYATVHLYADDTQLYVSFYPEEIVEVNNKLNEHRDILLKNAKNHCLELNPEKCQGASIWT